MKRFEILEDAEYDRYLIFIYGENRSICGVNYHHGIGDLDTSYLESDEELFKIYLERMRGRGNDDTQLSVMRSSIEEHRDRYNGTAREILVEEQVNQAMVILRDNLCRELYIKESELTKAQWQMIDTINRDALNTWRQIAQAQTKSIK